MDILTVLVATVASMIIGFLWYSPYLFGKPWQRLTAHHGRKQTGMALPVVASALGYFLTAGIFESANATPADMIKVLLLLWLVFCVALRLQNYLFEGRSLKLFMIYAGHDLATLMVIGSIVTLL
jgi:Protein of unknown function (DUF1761)